MENEGEEELLARWKVADGTFDQEAYQQDEEVQETLMKRRRLGIAGSISTEGVLMPAKARSTLVGPTRKRSRAEKSA